MYMLVKGKYPQNEHKPFTSSISVNNLQIHSNLIDTSECSCPHLSVCATLCWSVGLFTNYGGVDGESPCRMSIVGNGNVALLILRNGRVTLSIIRNGCVTLSILRNGCVACR